MKTVKVKGISVFSLPHVEKFDTAQLFTGDGAISDSSFNSFKETGRLLKALLRQNVNA